MDTVIQATKPDTLTQQIGVLTRREVEARMLIPVIQALGRSFGREDVINVIEAAIVEALDEWVG